MDIFYSNQIDKDRVVLSPEESQHCVRVMRHKEGDEVNVSGGDGNLYKCLIEKITSEGTELRILSVEGDFGKRGYYLHMAVAPTKNIDRFEWFLEKSTEIGVDEITPLISDHSERKILKPEREERVIIAAAKQSLKGYVPVLHFLTSVKDFIAQSADFEGEKYIAFCDHELVTDEGISVSRIHIADALSAAVKKAVGGLKVMVLIGPEGDFSREEVQCAAAAGFIPISLGDSRLRTETAALLAVAATSLAR